VTRVTPRIAERADVVAEHLPESAWFDEVPLEASMTATASTVIADPHPWPFTGKLYLDEMP
jgi:hypothetical protein